MSASTFSMYKVKNCSGQYYLAHLTLKCGVSLAGLVPPGCEELFIELAFSESRAMIKSTNDPHFELLCHSLFPEQRLAHLQKMMNPKHADSLSGDVN